MAFSLEELGRALGAEGLSPLLDPEGTRMQVDTYGLTGKLACSCSLSGNYWFLRTVGYAGCPTNNPQLSAVLQVLGDLNYRMNILKFCWDARDGEIMSTIETLAPADESAIKIAESLFFDFVRISDIQRWRIFQTIKTGRDPGSCSNDDVIRIIDSLLSDPEVPEGHKQWLNDFVDTSLSDPDVPADKKEQMKALRGVTTI